MQKTKLKTFTMKISYDIGDAKKDYPEMYHVVLYNEVHSFETLAEAKKDLKINSTVVQVYGDFNKEAISNFYKGFIPVIITPVISVAANVSRNKTCSEFDENYSKHANFNIDNTTAIVTPFQPIPDAKD